MLDHEFKTTPHTCAPDLRKDCLACE